MQNAADVYIMPLAADILLWEKNKMKKIDKFQQKAIEVSKNAVVSAGAGSGKTTVLSERFLYLVESRGCNVDEILTLTFTKKATVEMSSRIYKVLKENNSPQADDFYKAQIKTLDSYCSTVAKSGCHLYGISPDFTTDNAKVYETASSLALPFILEHRDNLSIKELVKTKNYSEIAESLFVDPLIANSTVAQEIDFDDCIDRQLNEVCSVWNRQCADFTNLCSALKDFIYADENSSGKVILKFRDFFELNTDLSFPELNVQQLKEERAVLLNEMEKFYVTVSPLNSISLAGKLPQDFKDCVRNLRDCFAVLSQLINYVYGLDITFDLIPLLKEFQDKLNSFKRTSGILTFKDVSSLALCILKDYPEIRKIEKQKYKAIMIDEFQDNNGDQRDLLFLLAEKPERMEKGVPDVKDLCPDKLFFVGDEKQSIYKFRGADVSVFRSLSESFKDGNLSMSTNYRSVPSLIASFNTIFGGVPYPGVSIENTKIPAAFYTVEQVEKMQLSVPDFEAVYNPVTYPDSVDLTKENYSPAVHFALYQKEQEAPQGYLAKEEAEAFWVASKIRELTSEGGMYKPSDIAILFIKYDLQPIYEQMLLGQGIPYNSECLTGFFSDGPVNDIYSVLRICVFKNDTLSYLQVLQGPFVNLTFEESNLILADSLIPFESNACFLSEASAKKYEQGKNIYLELQELSAGKKITEVLTFIWYTLGYRYETMWNKSVSNYSKMYDYLFEFARLADQNCQSLAEFVDNLRIYKDASKKLEDMEIPLDSSSGVHLMSIHKSKGLQFKVVFVVGAHKKTHGESNREPVYCSKEFGVTVNTPCAPFINQKTGNYFFLKTKETEDAKSAAELRRLVYVALTRAEKELYITNADYKKNDDAILCCPGENDGAKNPKSIFNVLEPCINVFLQDDGIPCKGSFFDLEMIQPCKRKFVFSKGRKNIFSEKQKLLQDMSDQKLYEKSSLVEKEIVPAKYMSPSKLYEQSEKDFDEIAAAENIKIPYHEINDIVDASDDFDYSNFGTIAHAYMEYIILQKEFKIPTKEILGLADAAKNIPVIESACKKMYSGFIDSELGKQAFDSKEKYCEFEFKSFVAGKLIKGVMDLVFKMQDGTWAVVDYKTNMSVQPQIYLSQLACYRNAISHILGVKASEIKCFLFYLRFAETVDVTQECNNLDLEEFIGKK